MAIQALVFDLDGTLLDSLADIGESMNSALESMGLNGHPLSDYRGFVGDGVRLLAERALPPERRDRESVDTCVVRMRQVYAPRAARRTRPYKGVPVLLDALEERGLPKAILSNKPHDLTVALVRAQLGRWGFEVVYGERSGIPRKPDPTGALEIATGLGLEPGSILYVGDTPTDMETARAAGMSSVGVTWGFRDECELRAAGADRIVHEPERILGILGFLSD